MQATLVTRRRSIQPRSHSKRTMSIKMRVTAAALAATTLGGVLWFNHRADAGTTPSYRLGKIERGNVKATVSATGTLGAVRTVEVGTQVSGQIAALYVD